MAAATLSRTLRTRCIAVLKQCKEFETHKDLKAVFIVDGLSVFQSGLPEAGDKDQRVSRTINYLLQKKIDGGETVFLLFLRALLDNYNERDQLYTELQSLLSAVEDYLRPKPSEPEKEVRKKNTLQEVGEVAIRKKLTRWQQNVCKTVIQRHENVKELQKTVKKSHAFFSVSHSRIYPSQCEAMLDPLLIQGASTRNFSTYLNNAPLPGIVQRLRVPLVHKLDKIDSLLSELRILKQDYCPRCLELPVERIQVQQKLQEINACIKCVNTLMTSFKKIVGPFEEKKPSSTPNAYTSVDVPYPSSVMLSDAQVSSIGNEGA